MSFLAKDMREREKDKNKNKARSARLIWPTRDREQRGEMAMGRGRDGQLRTVGMRDKEGSIWDPSPHFPHNTKLHNIGISIKVLAFVYLKQTLM